MSTTDDSGAKPPEGGDQADKTKSGGDDYGKPPTMGDLRAMVAETVEGALKPFMDKIGGSNSSSDRGTPAGATGGKTADAGDGPPDLAGMVNSAIEKVLGDKQKQDDDAAHRKQHEDLAARAEHKPVDRPRRSRWLGAIWDE